jgi:hypothetical protein
MGVWETSRALDVTKGGPTSAHLNDLAISYLRSRPRIYHTAVVLRGCPWLPLVSLLAFSARVSRLRCEESVIAYSLGRGEAS